MEQFRDFNHELLTELREQSAITGLPIGDHAFERLCETLEAEGEIEVAERAVYRGAASGKTLRIDGHGGDPRDAEGILSVIVCEIFEEDAPVTLNASDAKRLFGHVVNFISMALRPDFRNGLHINSPEFGITTMIAETWYSVLKVKLILVTNGVYSARTDAVLGGTLADVPVTYNVWDLTRLQRVETTGSKEKIVVKFAEEFGGALPALAASGAETIFPSYLAVIRGTQLARIYERWGARLLESNVRSFIQARRRSVNEGIRDTIRDEPEMFFSYNNGLSATADSLSIEEDGASVRILSATNLQIVNGGQTTASLHAALRKMAEHLDRIHVQIKITVVPSYNSEQVVPNISKYANNQNKVSTADFFSNHPFHLRVEGYSRRVLAPPAPGRNRQTRWFYERARGQYLVERAKLAGADRRRFDDENPKTQLFLKTDLAKVEFSFGMKPDSVSKGAQKNFSAFAETIGQTWSASNTKYDEIWFKRLVAKLIIFRTLESTIPRQKWFPGGYRAYILTYGIAKIVHDATEKGRVLDLDRIWADQAMTDDLLGAFLAASETAAMVITAPESGIRNITDWPKKQACWAKVRGIDVRYDDLDDCLIELEEAKAVQRASRRDEALVSGIEAQKTVVELGGAFWERLRLWVIPNEAFSMRDEGILRACGQLERRLPSERQCLLAIGIRARAREEGYLDEGETPRIRILGRPQTH